MYFFQKLKAPFYFNCAPALHHTAKGAFFSKSMDFQLSLEKKSKSISFLVNFFEKFKIEHKIHFFKLIFQKSENLTKHHFFCMFSIHRSREEKSIRKGYILLQKAENIFPKSHKRDKCISNIDYFIWSIILKKAPFSFENSVIFMKSVRVFMIFWKAKGAFF